jgi:ribonuclease Z
MLDVCLLGTGGMMPLPSRWLTSMVLKYKGKMVLVDCGEGTQITLKELGWGFKKIDTICFTHYHADHISGLPGLLLTIGNSSRTEPIKLIGPRGLKYVVDSLRVIAPELPFEIEFHELDKSQPINQVIDGEIIINSCKVNHTIDCVAYSFEIERPGKFLPEKAKGFNIPINQWSLLQNGQSVIVENREIEPQEILGPKRKGFKISYCTDARPDILIEQLVLKSDLFICEGMYGEDEMLEKAISKKHMIFSEAGKIAKKGEVKELWLTHFSPSLTNPEDHILTAKSHFENSIVGQDRMIKNFKYEE